MEKNRLHNRLQHGSGIVAGLKCQLQGGKLRIGPGIAVDCAGREIVVPETYEMSLPQSLPGPYVCLSYVEREVGPEPVVDTGDTGQREQMRFIEETYRVSFSARFSYAGHNAIDCRWEACGGDHEVALAVLVPQTHPRRVQRIQSGNLLFRLVRRLTTIRSGP